MDSHDSQKNVLLRQKPKLEFPHNYKEYLESLDQQRLLEEITEKIVFLEKPEYLPYRKDNYLFDLVTNQEELKETFALRFDAYTSPDVGYVSPEKYPLKMEFDIYDIASVHFFARNLDSGKLCGHMRMIQDTEELGLQVEIKLNVDDYRSQYVVCENSRMISHPRGQPTVNWTIHEIIKRVEKEMGIEKILGESKYDRKAYFDRVGILPMEPFRYWILGDKETWGAKNPDGTKREDKVYGNVVHLDTMSLQEMVDNLS